MPEQYGMPMQDYSGWNVNAPYMTPASMGNFRPGYQNQYSVNPFENRYSLGQSAWEWGPGNIGYGADFFQTSSAHAQNLASSPFDAAVTGMQEIGAPLAAVYGASKLSQLAGIKSKGMVRDLFGGGMGGAIGRRAGGMAGGAINRVAGATLGRSAILRGAAGAAGLGGGLAGAAGIAGGLAGSMMLAPWALGKTVEGMDATLFDPYSTMKEGVEGLRSSMSRQFVAGEGGSAHGGMGMSAKRAAEISAKVTEMGQSDFQLSGDDYMRTLGNMQNAGLFREVGDMDADKIASGVKDTMKVLKLVSRITGDPDIQNGIKTVASLRAGGIDKLRDVGVAVQKLQQASATSGISMQQMMDTVGNQGAQMAESMGMRGITGTLAAADAMAGFTNARKSGLISEARFASMGGAEGMTQSLISGGMKSLSSPMARMFMQGRSGMGGDLTSAISQWGSDAASNPLANQGDWFMNQGAYQDAAMKREGPGRAMLKMLKSQAAATGQDPNDGRVLAAMAQSMGISSQEFNAAALEDKSRNDAGASMNRRASESAAVRSDYASRMQQEGLGAQGIFGIGRAQRDYREFKSDIMGAGTGPAAAITDMWATGSDWLDETLGGSKMLQSDVKAGAFIADEDGTGGSTFNLQGFRGAGGGRGTGVQRMKTKQYDAVIERMNKVGRFGNKATQQKYAKALRAAQSGDKDTARKLMMEIDEETKGGLTGATNSFDRNTEMDKLTQLLDSGDIGITEESMDATLEEPEGFKLKGIGDFRGYSGDINSKGQRFYDTLRGRSRRGKMKDGSQEKLTNAFNTLATGTEEEKAEAMKVIREVGVAEFGEEGLTKMLGGKEAADKYFSDTNAITLRRSDSSLQREKEENAAATTEGALRKIRKSTLGVSDAGERTNLTASTLEKMSDEELQQVASNLGIELEEGESLRGSKLLNAVTGKLGEDKGDISNEEDLMKRLQERGISQADAQEFIKNKRGGNVDKLVSSMNDSMFSFMGIGDRNTTTEIDNLAEEIKKDKDATGNQEGTGTDWEGLKDFKEVAGEFVPSMGENTEAIKELTKAIKVAQMGGGSGFTLLNFGDTVNEVRR